MKTNFLREQASRHFLVQRNQKNNYVFKKYHASDQKCLKTSPMTVVDELDQRVEKNLKPIIIFLAS